MEILEQQTVNHLVQSKGLQTMEQLSSAVGVNRMTLLQIMTGDRRIVRGDTAKKIKQYLANQPTA